MVMVQLLTLKLTNLSTINKPNKAVSSKATYRVNHSFSFKWPPICLLTYHTINAINPKDNSTPRIIIQPPSEYITIKLVL